MPFYRPFLYLFVGIFVFSSRSTLAWSSAEEVWDRVGISVGFGPGVLIDNRNNKSRAFVASIRGGYLVQENIELNVDLLGWDGAQFPSTPARSSINHDNFLAGVSLRSRHFRIGGSIGAAIVYKRGSFSDADLGASAAISVAALPVSPFNVSSVINVLVAHHGSNVWKAVSLGIEFNLFRPNRWQASKVQD